MTTVVDAINEAKLMTILEVQQPTPEYFDIIGRVNDEQAGNWGTVMRNVLLQAMKTKNQDAVEFVRIYRLARRDILAASGITVRNKTTRQVLQVPELVLVWHWRIRCDERGALMLMTELQRLISLARRNASLGRDEVPINPAAQQEPMAMPKEFTLTQAATTRPTSAAEAIAQGYQVSGAK